MGAGQTAGRPRVGQAVRSPEVHSDRSVTFRFKAPNAKQVLLIRETAPAQAMTRDELGVWSWTSPSLAPDLYGYTFAVDGVEIADPANVLLKRRATGGTESLVAVPGPMAAPWDPADVPHGLLHRHLYQSKILGEARRPFTSASTAPTGSGRWEPSAGPSSCMGPSWGTGSRRSRGDLCSLSFPWGRTISCSDRFDRWRLGSGRRTFRSPRSRRREGIPGTCGVATWWSSLPGCSGRALIDRTLPGFGILGLRPTRVGRRSGQPFAERWNAFSVPYRAPSGRGMLAVPFPGRWPGLKQVGLSGRRFG